MFKDIGECFVLVNVHWNVLEMGNVQYVVGRCWDVQWNVGGRYGNVGRCLGMFNVGEVLWKWGCSRVLGTFKKDVIG